MNKCIKRNLKCDTTNVWTSRKNTLKFDFIEKKILILNLFDRASIQPILERRGMDINRVNVFVEASNTPLPLDCECFLLGGNTLNIKGRQYSREWRW